MYIDKLVMLKHNSTLQEGKVIKIFGEDLEIELQNGEKVMRKYWEIGLIPNKKNE